MARVYVKCRKNITFCDYKLIKVLRLRGKTDDKEIKYMYIVMYMFVNNNFFNEH